MAPTNPATPTTLRRAPATVVGVDVTPHKEERHITDLKKSHRQSNTRVRYYVELVVGSPRERHTRMGFSGTFKALLRLHAAFDSIFNAHHHTLQKPNAYPSSRESVSSATSASSAGSSASASHGRRASVEGPRIVPFPTASALLVKLQPRQHVESDAKASARRDALFTYYSQLFNSPERELFLDYIQSRAEGTANTFSPDNQHDDGHADADTKERRHGGFFKKLLVGLRRSDAADGDAKPRSERQRAAALDAKLEFAAPVHVAGKKAKRRV